MLRFPEDDAEAWKVLLHFVIRGTLPTIPHSDGGDHMSLQFVRCWCLGDKYCVPAFQDLTMVELLKYCESKAPLVGTIKDAFDNTPPGSRLRILMAECAVESFYDRRWYDLGELDKFDDTVGFTSAFAQALHKWHSNGRVMFTRVAIFVLHGDRAVVHLHDCRSTTEALDQCIYSMRLAG